MGGECISHMDVMGGHGISFDFTGVTYPAPSPQRFITLNLLIFFLVFRYDLLFCQ